MTKGVDLLSTAEKLANQGDLVAAKKICRDVLQKTPYDERALDLFGRFVIPKKEPQNFSGPTAQTGKPKSKASKRLRGAENPKKTKPVKPGKKSGSPSSAATSPELSSFPEPLAPDSDHKIDLGQVPSSRDQQLQLARLYETQGALAEAEQTYQDLLLQGIKDPEVYLALANVQIQRRLLKEAQATLQACLRDHPTHVGAFELLDTLLEEQQDFVAARDLCLQALVRDETSAVFLLGLARSLNGLGKPDEALAVFQKCYEMAPGWMPAAEGYCGALLDAKDPQQAWRLAQAGCESLTASSGLFDLLGQASEMLKHAPHESLKAAFGALQRDPHRVATYARMAPLLRQQDRLEEADLLYDYGSLLYWRPQSQAAGYLEMGAFHQDLLLELKASDSAKGDLLQRRSAAMQTLELLLEQAAKEYLQLVTGLPGHPYFIKPPVNWQVSALGLCLQSSDYRSPAIQQGSYLSGFYFVEVPKEVSEGTGETGCVRFFDSATHDDAMSFETLRPKEGLLVLFPSYFWCGTIPFASEDTLWGYSIQVSEKPVDRAR